jgi:hypothetical protein
LGSSGDHGGSRLLPGSLARGGDERHDMNNFDLTMEEHQMLERAADADGRFSYRGLSLAEMRHLRDVATVLKGLGLLNFVVQDAQGIRDNPDLLVVEITQRGSAYLREANR